MVHTALSAAIRTVILAMIFFTAVPGGGLAAPGTARAGTFPAPLLGKSVTVTWTQNRHVAYEGNVTIANQTQVFTVKIYISTAARAFSRETGVTASTAGIHGAKRFGGSHHENQGPDDGGGSGRGVNVVHMDGGKLVVDRQMIEGARRVAVTFDAGYGSCNARVIHGREGGAGAIRGKNPYDGTRYEVLSMQASTPDCTVTSGNVVGD
jgi:hypothetical protein